MRNKNNPTQIFLLSLLPVVFLSLTTQSSNSDLIYRTCKQTPYYDLCLSSLQSDPRISDADTKGLAGIIAADLLSNASDTLNFVERLIKHAKDQQMERSLAYCAELYIPVVKYNLPQAIDALSKGQFGFAKDGISDTAKEVDACEKKFSGSKESPLSQRNDLVRKLCDVADAIVDILLQA